MTKQNCHSCVGLRLRGRSGVRPEDSAPRDSRSGNPEKEDPESSSG